MSNSHDEGNGILHPPAACPSCRVSDIGCVGAIPDTDLFAGRKLRRPLPGGYLYRCHRCGLQFRFPALSQAAAEKLYATGNPNNWHQQRRIDWEIAAGHINSHLKSGKILDIGCFDGGFLSSLEGRFQCYGIEMNQEAASLCRRKNLSIIGSEFSAVSSCKDEYDAVVAFDVLEHSRDPRQMLCDMARATRSSGLVIISTGNTQALSYRLLKNRYWYCTIAEHVSFLSPDWCKRNAKTCGLSLEFQERFSHAATGRSILPRLKETIFNLTYWKFPGLFKQLRYAGLGGKNVRRYPELLNHPPGWMTAKDHFIAVLHRNS